MHGDGRGAFSRGCEQRPRGKDPTATQHTGHVENWLAPGGGHGCRLKEGGGGEMDTCDRTYVWSSLSAFFF